MPKAVPAWVKALSILASRNAVPQQDDMTNGGFVVPPPCCIVLPMQEHIVATLFRSPDVPIKLSNKCWRSLLDVSGGLNTGSLSTTRSGTQHTEM
ncbi:hypothetical protein BDP27DRAFT_1211115 [Rhodocollybia butyracea]|uniref:Uncharacterized protein n=1 Tax=Rhodocollybia butyracea TaxID=206335 RepID=A0A9P5UDC2_9AGAR|nr:hypothetical protein BDP27DRAFT_1211115 [Rhodocollybia butyracea]